MALLRNTPSKPRVQSYQVSIYLKGRAVYHNHKVSITKYSQRLQLKKNMAPGVMVLVYNTPSRPDVQSYQVSIYLKGCWSYEEH